MTEREKKDRDREIGACACDKKGDKRETVTLILLVCRGSQRYDDSYSSPAHTISRLSGLDTPSFPFPLTFSYRGDAVLSFFCSFFPSLATSTLSRLLCSVFRSPALLCCPAIFPLSPIGQPMIYTSNHLSIAFQSYYFLPRLHY